MTQQLDVVGVGEAMLLLQAPPGTTLEETASVSVAVAGAELTVCATSARLGATAGFVSRVGDDAPGRRVCRAVHDLGVDGSSIEIDGEHPTGVFLRESLPDGERRVTYYRRGSAASTMDASMVDAALRKPPRAIVISGLTLALGDGPRHLVTELVHSAAAADTQVVVDVNLRPALGIDSVVATLRGLLPEIDLLLLGDDESPAMFGETEPARVFDAAEAAGVPETVLKGGPRGCWVRDTTGVIRHQPSLATRVVDPVGAGDAFLGGYLVARLAGAAAGGAAWLGSHMSAAVVAVAGDTEGLPSWSEGPNLLARSLEHN